MKMFPLYVSDVLDTNLAQRVMPQLQAYAKYKSRSAEDDFILEPVAHVDTEAEGMHYCLVPRATFDRKTRIENALRYIDTYMDDDALEFYNRSDSRLRSGKVFGTSQLSTRNAATVARLKKRLRTALKRVVVMTPPPPSVTPPLTPAAPPSVTPPLTSSPPPSEHTNLPTFTAEQSQTHVDARPVRTGRRTSRAMGRT